MTSGAVIVRRENLKKSRGRVPRGVQPMAPVTDRTRQLPVERMMGVLPLGAQVRLTVGRSENPDSSRKIRRDLVLSPFF